jgi:uncharacterized membrane protein
MNQPKQRFVYIDLLRGWAVLVMIEVHVVNAFLLPEFREAAWFPILNFINGLVAPSFLFISGYAFVLVAQRKWNDYIRGTPVLWKQLGRILQILAVGYVLHIPVFSFSALTQLPWEGWDLFWRIDVLHAIAVSLLVLLGLVLVLRDRKRFLPGMAVLSLAIIFGTPYMYDRNIDSLLPVPLANYFTAAHGSLFPLFPWMAFVLCGGVTAQLTVEWKERLGDSKIFTLIFLTGIGLIGISLMTDLLPGTLLPPHEYGRAHPGFFFIRLGIVLMLLSVLRYWEQRYRSGRSMVSVVGSESLVAYTGHLLVIYGEFFNSRSAGVLIGNTRSIPEVTGMTVVLIAATIAVSYVWHRIKNWSMFYARVLMMSILIAVMIFFFIQ